MCTRPIEHCGAARPVKQRGLTLIELLVAISVLGFVAVLGWRGLDSIVRARIALTAELEQTRGMQIAFAQMQNDCAHLASATILPNKPSLAAAQGKLMLIRTIFTDNQPSRLQVIAYQVRDGVLTRRESAETRDLTELDALWLATAQDIDTTQAVALQPDVTAMEMRVWIGGTWRAGAGAMTQAALPPGPPGLKPPGLGSPAPTGLEVTLQLRGSDSGMQKIFLLGAV